MKVAKSVSWSTTTVPPPLKRRTTGSAAARTASTSSISSALPEMPSTAAFAASAGPSHSFVKNQECALSALNSASSSRSIRKIGVLRRRSQSARGFEAAIGVLVDVSLTRLP